MTNQYYPVLWL